MSIRTFCLLILFLLPLAACGFQPLYAVKSESAAVATVDDLRFVDIAQIQNRRGQLLRNALLATFPPMASSSKYGLRVIMDESIDDFNIRRDTTATFARLTVTANFTLYDKNQSDKVLLTGAARAGNSYNILASTYATSTAEEDARERAAKQLAEDIKLRVASYFAAKSAITP